MNTVSLKEVLFRRSGRLFALPSFAGGMARAIDLGGTLNEYNQSRSAEEADYIALLSDWYAVGDDLRYAVVVYEKEHAISSS